MIIKQSKIKPSKITINGEFWDIYLYQNKFYLFMFKTKEIKIIDWCNFVDQFCNNPKLELGYRCAFWNSDYLYDVTQKGIFDDKEFKDVLIRKFERIEDIVVDENDDKIQKWEIYRIKSSYPQYFADMDVYNNKIYLGCENGIYYASINKKRLKTKPGLEFIHIESTSSLNVSSMKFMSGGDLLLSTQDTGLYEYNTFLADRTEFNDENYNKIFLKQISSEHSSYVGTNYSSVLSASYIKEPTFIQRDYAIREDDKKERIDKKKYNIAEIFNDNEKKGFYFSFNEKIYQILNSKLSCCHFLQKEDDKDKIFYNIENIKEINDINNEDIVSASVETFGVVIECKNKLIVLLSDDSIYEYISDETSKIVSFRTYPRSNCYTNQLHIIYNNKIEIISFNQDYFEDQNSKKIGIKFRRMTRV